MQTDALPCHINFPVCLWIMNPHSTAPKKNIRHGNEVLPQDTTHLIQRPCYQRGSPCQDPAGNWITRRPPDDRKEMQTAVVWSCFPFIRSGQNHLARHNERGKKTRPTEAEMGRQHQGMDRPWVCQVPEGSGEQGKMEKTGCKSICGAQTTLTVKGLMMMMMMMVGRKFSALCVLDSDVDTFANSLKEGLLSTAGEVLRRQRKKIQPWVTNEVLDLCDQRRHWSRTTLIVVWSNLTSVFFTEVKPTHWLSNGFAPLFVAIIVWSPLHPSGTRLSWFCHTWEW